jgi:hypothetical protein
MDKIILLLMGMVFMRSIKAQPYDNKGIVMAGGTYQNTNNVLDWSMGVQISVYPFLLPHQLLFTTGILQGNPSLLSNTNIRTIPSLQVMIGPQPASHFIYLRLNQPEVIIQSLRIFNIQSILIYQKKGPLAGILINEQINIDAIAPGMFFLMIDYSIENKIHYQQIFKLIKN